MCPDGYLMTQKDLAGHLKKGTLCPPRVCTLKVDTLYHSGNECHEHSQVSGQLPEKHPLTNIPHEVYSHNSTSFAKHSILWMACCKVLLYRSSNGSCGQAYRFPKAYCPQQTHLRIR